MTHNKEVMSDLLKLADEAEKALASDKSTPDEVECAEAVLELTLQGAKARIKELQAVVDQLECLVTTHKTFHDVAVKQRNGAWREIEAMKTRTCSSDGCDYETYNYCPHCGEHM